MKTKIFTVLLFGLTLSFHSCYINETRIIPNGKVTTSAYTFSDYDMIDVSSAFTVYLTFSDTEESIEIEADENLHEYIEVKKENGVLEIGFERNISVRGSATLKAHVTTRDVSGYAASGASRFLVTSTIISDNAHIYLSGASTFSGKLVVDQLFADLSGASVSDLEGTANTFEAEASGASVIRDYTFSTNFLNAEISGASNMHLTVQDEIDIEASGASVLHYKGPAVISRQDISGASVIKKVN